MPWQEASTVSLRKEFVELASQEGINESCAGGTVSVRRQVTNGYIAGVRRVWKVYVIGLVVRSRVLAELFGGCISSVRDAGEDTG